MIDAGFAPGSEFLWPFHYSVYWDVTQRWYREEVDPTWDGDLEAGSRSAPVGTPTCDADYDYASRPEAVKDAVRSIEPTGRIGKPLVTIHGTLDTLLPIGTDSDVYDRLIDAGGGSGTATTASPTAPTPTACTPPSPTGSARCCRAPAPPSACSPTGSSGASSRRPTPPTRDRRGTC